MTMQITTPSVDIGVSNSPNTQSTAPPAGPPPTPFTYRLLVGIVGIFIAAVMAGLNNRVGALALVDVRGVFGIGADEGSWLSTVYTAAELVAMPFSVWLATTFSFRRFHMAVVGIFTVLAIIMPFAPDLTSLLILRGAQGFAGGLLIPVLMAGALRFFPPPLRLYGLALYAMTATFSPNLAIWFTAQWTDVFLNWQLVYWQIIPMAILVIGMVGWGIPQDPVRLERFKQMNWFGMITASIGLAMIAIALDQGARMDWWRSDLFVWLLLGGIVFTAVFITSEWFHPAPFIKPQPLGRRNIGLGCMILVCLLMVSLSGSMLPSMYLERIWGYRNLQMAPIGLLIAIPQLILGFATSFFLYKKWIDARIVFSMGLGLIGLSCILGSQLTLDWLVAEFVVIQVLQAFGQPMAVVSLLFLVSSVVQPMEGPFIAGTINTVRAFGTLIGGSAVGYFITMRERFHSEMLLEHMGSIINRLPEKNSVGAIASSVQQQAFILANADAYLFLGLLAFLMIPLVMCLQRISPPDLKAVQAIKPQ